MAETNSSNEIRGVLLPLNSGKLLLPNAAISEVVSYRQPERLDGDKPGWLLGHFSWRQQQIPLVCFDSLVGQQAVDAGTVHVSPSATHSMVIRTIHLSAFCSTRFLTWCESRNPHSLP